MRFDEVPLDEIPNMKEAHRGRVSYPILKSFLETGYVCAKLDRTGMQQSLQSLTSSLTAYIRNHDLPLKMFMRKGEIYLMRLDLNPDGTENPDWQDEMRQAREDRDVRDINPEEVARRFTEEKDKVTK